MGIKYTTKITTKNNNKEEQQQTEKKNTIPANNEKSLISFKY